jgi:hypothetical protein
MFWDISAIVCAVLALVIRWGCDDARGGALLSYLSLVCGAWSTYRRRRSDRAEAED